MILAAWLLVSALAGCGPAAVPTAAPQPAQAGSLSGAGVVSASAIVAPFREAVLRIRISGRLLEILVSEGQEVSAGQGRLCRD